MPTAISTDATAVSWRTSWSRRLRKLVSRTVIFIVALLIGALGMRAWMSRSAPELRPWHTVVPEELGEQALDQSDWTQYLLAEDRVLREVAVEVSAKLDPVDRGRFNRYDPASKVYPGRFHVDWNRSYALEPAGSPTGIVVLLHGLSDSPYSLRHIAEFYRARGFVALGLRLPAHGTVPGALTRVEWQEWLAAVRLAMREAARRSDRKLPVQIVGYSNGGALAVKYALDAIEDASLVRPERIVLLSPMIGVSGGARYAGMAGWPAVLPAFATAAWLDNLPEFNPFKYNSFPVNAARQSYLLTDALQKQIVRLSHAGRLVQLPPLLTFQSTVDATVITSAVATALYAYLPANGSELVLFDINREVDVGYMLRPGALLEPSKMLTPPPRMYRVTVLTNAGPRSREVVARITEAGEREERVQETELAYPPEVFSLSHIALPFPVGDGLYGLAPDPRDDFGVHLGTLSARGERGVLLNGLDITTMRISSNPFFPYIVERIGAGIAGR